MIKDYKIKVGDKVNVFWERDALFDLLVLYVPCSTGDSWILEGTRSPNIRSIHYVQIFCRMDKI